MPEVFGDRAEIHGVLGVSRLSDEQPALAPPEALITELRRRNRTNANPALHARRPAKQVSRRRRARERRQEARIAPSRFHHRAGATIANPRGRRAPWRTSYRHVAW